jgi:16S rRNA (cytosine967-C5)-methyltransferase
VTREFDRRGWRWQRSAVLASAMQLLDEADVTQTEAYARGLVEIQDLGSQLLLESAGPLPGERWLDACAGAGGKTLQLSRLLGPAGHIDAHDIRPVALHELAARARRSRALNITVLPGPATGGYDGVLVDAPCSGSGTWRRAPHLKWTTDESDVAAAAARQLTLLSEFSARVRPGGRLMYATCSLSRMENEAVVAAFLAAQPGFAVAPPVRDFGGLVRGGGLTFLPSRHDTDGFFAATFRRN